MTTKRDAVKADLAHLQEMSTKMRDVLERNERAMAMLVEHLDKGESVLEAFDAMDGVMRKHRELPETLEQFEMARHQARLALFALAIAQGATISELGRRLGISRQLASRLAAAAREHDS